MPHFGEPRMKSLLGMYYVTMGAAVTQHFALGADTMIVAEGNAQAALPPGRFLLFKLNVIINTLTVDMTAALRVNGADSALILVVPAGATGAFTIRAVVPIAEDDLCNFRFVVPAGAGAISCHPLAVFEAA